MDHQRGNRKGKAKAWKAKPPRGEWVTSIEAISAAGRLLAPFVICKRDIKVGPLLNTDGDEAG